MARYDRDITINTPNTQKNIDKPKGQMSIREAAAMEMPNQDIETGMPGTTVHGFGNGSETPKRHTDSSDMDMDMDMRQPSADESLTAIIEQLFQLPFHAQLSVMRMLASKVLGAMDAMDQEKVLRDLRMELDTMMSGQEMHEPHGTDLQGT